MAQYEVMWVNDSVIGSNGTQRIPNASRLMNDMAMRGWTVHSVVPGTNAQTYSGLFITFYHD
ncbi:hypothetical protein [Rhodococcus sp. HS-D2]|uniref:hypothetical protein n=1 Tax=Rhodococcus sp. HS-D2 TaxID=1384636 RepID=UPI0012E930D5|nr:hypothetical protein [Rhodococcus sp. HS-D2]